MKRNMTVVLIVGLWVFFFNNVVLAQLIPVDVINTPVEESLNKAQEIYIKASSSTGYAKGAVQVTQAYAEAQTMMMYLTIKQNDKIILLLQEIAGKTKKK